MAWFRWFEGAAVDPKFQVVARRTGQPAAFVVAVWAMLLERASSASERGCVDGFDCEGADAVLGLPDGAACAIVQAMKDKGLIDELRVCRWEERQPKRERADEEASTSRVREFRERQKANGNVELRHETPCNAMKRHETPRADKIREKKKEDYKTPPTPQRGESGCVDENRVPVSSRKKRGAGETVALLQAEMEYYAVGNAALAAALESFRVMREKIRKPLTLDALRLTCRELEKLCGDDAAGKVTVLEQSVQRGWQGVFAVKAQASRASPGQSISGPGGMAISVRDAETLERDQRARRLLEKRAMDRQEECDAQHDAQPGRHAGLADGAIAALPASTAHGRPAGGIG